MFVESEWPARLLIEEYLKGAGKPSTVSII